MHTFEITIQRKVGESFPVITEEHRDGGHLPVRIEGELRLDQNELLAIEINASAYGHALGEALFSGGVRDAFVEALAHSTEPLRVLLFIEDQTMRGLRWERLYAPIDGDWKLLSTFPRAPFSRYMPSLTDRRFPPIGRRDLRALIIAASPAPDNRFHLEPFDVAASVDGVRTALKGVPSTLLADIDKADGRPTLDEICARITTENYTILHIVCHGRVIKGGESLLFLAGNDGPGTIDPVTGTELLDRLSSLEGARGLPHFTFLSTCESASPDADEAMGGLGQRLVHDLGMPAVVAMTDKVSIVTANALAAAIYQRLREHGEPDRALVEGAVRLAERGDVMVPVLFSRLGGRPLFSDTLDRALTPAELAAGLDALEQMIPERAPMLATEIQQHVGALRRTLDRELEKLSPEARQEHTQALAAIGTICAETVDLSFQGLCLGEEPPAYDARCPFPGLRSFQGDAKAFFFGRKALVQKLQQRMAKQPFLAVLGPSGSGKSSLIFAGLAPALQEDEPSLRPISFTPGESPRASLAAALARADEGVRAMLIVDQFEEAFTLCQDADERKAFFEQLLKLPEQHLVVITMRADFLGEVAPYANLRTMVTTHQELVAPMTPEELRQAMEQQAAAVGLRFEADLGGQILDDVRDEPGVMPLLQHALQELWQRRRGRWLRAAEYRAIGGIQQAIAHSADQIYDACAPDDKERLRGIFVRLTRLDAEGGEGAPRDTRQRVALANLVPAGADPAPIRALVSRLADARLLVTTSETAEVAHEALIRGWPRLRSWLSEDRQSLLLREEVHQAARNWAAAGKKDGRLFRDEQLDSALALARQPRFGLNAEEQEFLNASLALRQREEAEREAARQRELQAAKDLASEQEERARAERLRAEEAHIAAAKLRQRAIYIAGAAGLALIAAISAVLFLVQAQEQRANAIEARAIANENERKAVVAEATAVSNEQTAVAERDRADENAKIAEQNYEAAVSSSLDAAVKEAIISGDNSRAIALSQEWLKQAPENRAALHALSEAAYTPGIRRQFDLTPIAQADSDNAVSALALSPNGAMAVTGHYSNTLAFWNLNDGSLAFQRPHAGGRVLAVAFDPRGDDVAVSDLGLGLSISSLNSERPIAGGEGIIAASLAFSPDGALLASGQYDGTIILWGVSDDSRRSTLSSPDTAYTAVRALAFSPDNQQILAGYSDGVARLWDVASGQLLVAFDGSDSSGTSAQVRHSGQINSVAFAFGGAIAITGSDDKTIGFWDVANRAPSALTFYTGHTAAVRSVDVDPKTSTLISASADGTIRVWSLSDARAPLTLNVDEYGMQGAFFLPESDGAQVVSFGNSMPPQVWDLNDGRQRQRLLINTMTGSIDLSADATLAVAPTEAGAALIDVVNNTDSGEFSFPNPPYYGIAAITAGGDLAASSTLSNTIVLWDPRSGEPAGELTGPAFPITTMAFDPDGGRLAATTEDAMLWIWDLANDSVSRFNLTAPANAEWPAFAEDIAWSPNGQTLLLGTDSGGWIWNIQDGVVATTFAQTVAKVFSVAFSQAGDLVALGAEDGAVDLYNASDGTYIASVKHRGPVRAVGFSPDGTRLVSAADDQYMQVWDLKSESYDLVEKINTSGHSVEQLVVVAYEPGYNSIITSGADNTIRMWDLFNPDELPEWIATNRYVPALSCEDLAAFGLCDPDQQTPTP